MKYISAFFTLIAWILATIILILSVIGLIIVITDTWSGIPNKILKVFE